MNIDVAAAWAINRRRHLGDIGPLDHARSANDARNATAAFVELALRVLEKGHVAFREADRFRGGGSYQLPTNGVQPIKVSDAGQPTPHQIDIPGSGASGAVTVLLHESSDPSRRALVRSPVAPDCAVAAVPKHSVCAHCRRHHPRSEWPVRRPRHDSATIIFTSVPIWQTLLLFLRSDEPITHSSRGRRINPTTAYA